MTFLESWIQFAGLVVVLGGFMLRGLWARLRELEREVMGRVRTARYAESTATVARTAGDYVRRTALDIVVFVGLFGLTFLALAIAFMGAIGGFTGFVLVAIPGLCIAYRTARRCTRTIARRLELRRS
jgi:hypothetical protein